MFKNSLTFHSKLDPRDTLNGCADWLREIKRPVFILFAIYILSASAIIRSNFMYMDDFARVDIGYRRWTEFGRYISEYLSPIIHGNSYLADVSPLPQVIAILMCTLAAIFAIRAIAPNKKITLLTLVAAFPIGFNPYFLQCLSYKYDAPYMAMSVFLSIFPLVFRKKTPVYILISLLSVLGVCMSYQASLGIYPIIVILIAFLEWNSGKDFRSVLRFILTSAACFLISVFIFYVFLVDPVESYVDTHLSSTGFMLSDAFRKLMVYFEHVRYEFSQVWLILMGVIAVSFIALTVINTRKHSALALVLAIVALVLMLMLTFGCYPLLAQPSYANRGKYGISVMFGLLAVAVFTSPKACISKIAPVALAWCFFVFSFAYGNALNMQVEYSDFRTSMVAEDLAQLDNVQSGETVTVHITGTIGLAPSVKNASKYQPLLRTIYVPLNSDGWWGSYGLIHYYGLDNLKHGTLSDVSVMETAECMVDNAYHTILAEEQNVYIILK